MPRRFNWTQKDAQNLVDEYLSGKIPSARNLYNRMRASGIHISKNTVYSRVRGELKAKRLRPRISLLAVPKPAALFPDAKGNYRIPWHSQSVKRILDSYIIYKKEKSLREVGNDMGALFEIPSIKKEGLKNHVLERRRVLNSGDKGKSTFRKFDRANFIPTDSEYYNLHGKLMFKEIDKWYETPQRYTKWDLRYDEPISKSWFQTVCDELSKSAKMKNSEDNAEKSDEKSENSSDNLNVEPQEIPTFDINVESKLTSVLDNYKIRVIHHERQNFRSFIVEEQISCFYHYIQTKTITAECSECREQWRLHSKSGSIARLLISERHNKVLEVVCDSHHINCQPKSEAEIRKLEIKRNICEALAIDDELLIIKKADKMARREISKLTAELEMEK